MGTFSHLPVLVPVFVHMHVIFSLLPQRQMTVLQVHFINRVMLD